MNNRERMLAIMAGEPPDRIPWIPRPEIWYQAHKRQGTLPQDFQGLSLQEVRHQLGMGTWHNMPIYRTELRDVETHIQQHGRDTVTEYVTPRGTVSTRYRESEHLEEHGMIGQTVEKMIKGPEDYAVVEYLIQHTEIIPEYDAFRAQEEAIGDDGYPMVYSAMDPISQLMLDYVGYNQVYYHLHDYPKQVARISEVLEEQAARIQQVVLDSPARLVMCGSHFSSMMTPPKIFRQMMPYYQSFSERLHQQDKLLVCHADADTSLLLELLVEAGYDLMDSFVTAPMVPVTLAQARAVFGERVIVWGGLPSTLLCDPTTDEEFEDYMMYLFQTIAPGDAFILAVADNIMPETKLERLYRVVELIEEYGTYPVHT
jgi:uroporphyrinogen-III decarboxylase